MGIVLKMVRQRKLRIENGEFGWRNLRFKWRLELGLYGFKDF